MSKTRRLAPIGSGIAVLLVALGCGVLQSAGVPASPGQAQEPQVRTMLITELTRRASAHSAPDSTNTRFVDVSSAVVPHLMYHWGMYYPRSSPEGQFSAVVAKRGAHALLVETASDWIRAVGPFVPTRVDDVVGACREMILVTNLPRSPSQPFAVFTAPETIDSLPLAIPDPEYLRRRLSPPDVTGDPSHGWQARLWVVHRRVARHYQCRIGPDGGLSVLDSLPGYGFY
jgi:hypothetical protein